MNKVILIGRLTRDPEAIANGSGAKFGFAANGRKKDKSGQWVDDPMFIDCTVWNRGEGTMATRAATTLHKGSHIAIEGKLTLETWDDKETGAKRSKHTIVVDHFEYLDAKGEGGGAATTRVAPRQPVVPPADVDDGNIPF